MLQLLINFLTPIFGGMGVSPEDVQQYVNDLGGYIYAILGTLVLAIAVIIIAQFKVKKGTRHVVAVNACLAWVLLTAILANVICFGPMYNNLAPIINGGASVSEESAAASREIMREVGDEGIVLVKNNGLLPLTNTQNLNVFGWSSIAPIFGGTGSGSSDTSSAVGILQSLEMAGFNLNSDLSDMYTAYRPDRTVGGTNVSYTDWTLPEPTVDHYTDDLMNSAKAHSDTAVIVLARSGGEGQDIPRDMYAVIHGTYDPRAEVANNHDNYNFFNCNYDNNGSYDDFDPGESYLELSNTEEAMIDKVTSEFDNVIVVVNANNPLELGWVDEYDNIGAVLLVPGTGQTAMEGLGRILSGEVNPSGRTIETYVYDLTSTPSYANSGGFTYTNIDALRAANEEADPAYVGTLAFVNYVEGIYVGYKFYETAAEEGFLNYDEHVQYPFGYGLSYTTFSQEITNFQNDGTTVTMDVNVTNTGSKAGKEVVELYFTPPYNNGGIEKASVNLINFAKTATLEPGASESVHFEIPLEDMASYDSTGIKTANGGYILEAGDYTLSIRSNSHTVLDAATFTIDSDIDYSVTGRESDDAVATNQFQDYSAGTVTYLSRADGFANYAQATAAPANSAHVLADDILARVTAKTVAFYDSTAYDDSSDVMPTLGANNGRKLAEYTGVDYDDPSWEELLDQLSVDDMISMVNLGGFQTVAVDSVGKVATLDSDGTAGLNDWYIGVYGTPYPSETLISQTWNKDLAYRVGEATAQEYVDCGIFGWYGPAMNTHRSAFCGRNFEYYSEDGVLAGYIASASINAAAEKGVYAYIKHFVLNDQETNRTAILLTWSDEQCIREIYMKPFEICVKNFDIAGHKPLAVMSSFNFIGEVASGANPYLLNNVLRSEWGFRGMVLSDWNGSYGYQNTDDFVRNGNDAMLGFGRNASNAITNTGSATLVKAMRQAAKNIMYTVANSGAYTVQTEQSGMDRMTTMFIGIDVAIAAVLIAVEAIVLVPYFKKNSKKEK